MKNLIAILMLCFNTVSLGLAQSVSNRMKAVTMIDSIISARSHHHYIENEVTGGLADDGVHYTNGEKNFTGTAYIDVLSNTMDQIIFYTSRKEPIKIYCKNNDVIKVIMNGVSYYHVDENYFTTDPIMAMDASTLSLLRRWEQLVNLTRFLLIQPTKVER